MRHRIGLDQQSDRVGLVLLPGGEAWIAAGKGLDLGAVVRGNADTRPVAGSHAAAPVFSCHVPCRPARLRETDIALRGARAGVLPQGQDEARPHVPDPALTRIDGAGLDRPARRLGPKRGDRHRYALTPSLRRLRSALVIVSVEPDRRTPTRNLYTPVTRKLMRFGSVVVLESGRHRRPARPRAS